MYLRQVPTRAKEAYCLHEQVSNLDSDEALPMKNPYEVMRMKEQEMLRIRKEMEALRIAAKLLGAEDPVKTNGSAQPALSGRVVEMP
jgi:hypothetical protein